MKKATLSLLTAGISLMTTSGILVHDIHLDGVVSVHTQQITKAVASDYSGDPHTHPSHAKSPINGFSYQNPSYPPRDNRMKRYMTQNYEPRGRHAFDSQFLPVIG